MRHLLLCCLLLSGCGGGSLIAPGMSARDAVLDRARKALSSAAVQNSVTQSQRECVVNYVNKSMNDDEMRRTDAALASGGDYPLYTNVVDAAAKTCIPN